jgi:hypothetical protein
MNTLSELAFLTAVAAVSIASPAFAQAFDPEVGTGNVTPFSYTANAPRADKLAVRQGSQGKMATRQSSQGKTANSRSGLHAFAMVPGGAQPGLNSNDPALTGGGRPGYNQMLLTY